MPIQAKPGELLRIQDKKIADETVIVSNTKSVNWISDSEFVNCTFDIGDANVARIGRCRLINCIFQPRKKVKVGPIGDNYWENCIFHGHYEGTHFGCSDDDIDGPSDWPEVALRGCDFSRAIMAGCHFQRLDTESTQFPSWP